MLVPVYGHRYIPAQPHESGNPVVSVYQTDIIFYGLNLEDWIEHEFQGGEITRELSRYKRIPFWTELIEEENRRS